MGIVVIMVTWMTQVKSTNTEEVKYGDGDDKNINLNTLTPRPVITPPPTTHPTSPRTTTTTTTSTTTPTPTTTITTATTMTTTTTTLPPTTTPVISAYELSETIQRMWDAAADKMMLINRDYILHFQGRTNYTDTVDRAESRLFHKMINKIRNHSSLHRKFVRLLRIYQVTSEAAGGSHVEQDSFIDDVIGEMNADTLQILKNILIDKGLLSGSFRDFIYNMWFAPYPMSTDQDDPMMTNGFQNVFVGTYSGTELTGINNWMQFYYLEKEAKQLDYQGYVKKHELGLVEARYTWEAGSPHTTSFFVGPSPDFEMGLYTLCLVVRTNELCQFSLAGYDMQVQTRDVLDMDSLQILSAEPIL